MVGREGGDLLNHHAHTFHINTTKIYLVKSTPLEWKNSIKMIKTSLWLLWKVDLSHNPKTKQKNWIHEQLGKCSPWRFLPPTMWSIGASNSRVPFHNNEKQNDKFMTTNVESPKPVPLTGLSVLHWPGIIGAVSRRIIQCRCTFWYNLPIYFYSIRPERMCFSVQ